ncbi:hypothetical protein HBI25_184740 [Parastagonospora nodorum]|nr:hypothetical protein HBI47_085600 [Parastagonospora nodorum]KAH5524112.1 hypothetical protein HBI29_040060 [Parastagonospora nodorum]KAH5551198.1 hypothetical protein HBI25_184740 [Parastagonospora nodorum]KAH5701696.1 hypothetical protein HBI44_033830 [Parastagonospora nodorum]
MVEDSMSLESAAHPKVDALIQWFTEHGGQLSDAVQIAFNDSRGFHMRAVRPLQSPVVVTCPLKLTLSCLNLDPEQKHVLFVDSRLQPCQGKIPDHILTYLLLIEQRNKGKESPWHAYIACLPGAESMTTPLWFDDEDMAFLAGTSLAPAAKERKSLYYQQWEQALGIMKDAGVALADEIDFESLLWAATIFTSRAFISTHILPDHETVPLLFPIVDILNHSVSAKVEWEFQPLASFSLKLLEGDTFTAGQELFNNYAPKQNDELLLGYGFCLEHNPIEQFPLKLAFPPMLQEYAEAMGLFKPERVPFGMSTDFLEKNPNTEQHFLRAKDHPFGRYDNCVPFFRGIPPYIVHFFFIQTLLSRELELQDINVQRPGARITLQVLTLLHQAMTQRSQTLPLSFSQEPQNDKQKYAKIYRDGQAKIVHSIRLELQSAIDRIRAPTDQTLPKRGVLFTTDQAIAALTAELPISKSQYFNTGIKKHNLIDESLIWTLLLVTLVAHSLTHKEGPIAAWLCTLYTQHPLPSLEDGIEDADTYTFVDENIGDFCSCEDVLEMLDGVGEKFARVGDDKPALLSEPMENLGVRVIMWAMKVVEREVLPILNDGVVCKCLYMTPWLSGADEDEGDGWMYQE